VPKTWACPYWRWEDKLKVCCEGCSMKFRSVEARENYIDQYCANVPGWEGCPVAVSLGRDYERRIQNEEYRQDCGSGNEAGGRPL